jgi:hypothetical protein
MRLADSCDSSGQPVLFGLTNLAVAFARLCLLLQVYQLSIGAACGLSWPSDRLVVQVLDDSTDPVVKVRLLTNPIGIISANDAAVSSKLFFVPPSLRRSVVAVKKQ